MDWPLLQGVDDEVRRAFLGQTQRRRFARRQALFHEGDLSDGMYLIELGWVLCG